VSALFRQATAGDAPAIHALVESAYRGASAEAGWTHEADLLGGQRMDLAQLEEIIAGPAQAVLLLSYESGLLGCVQVTRKPGGAYLGLLTVRPTLQGGGLGRRLIAEAERYAVANFAAAFVEMTVIKQRPELIAWYVRRGYADTGRELPFPMNDRRFGEPKRDDLVFVVLSKRLK
jgi:predicted N-acetyltransferase YhbS